MSKQTPEQIAALIARLEAARDRALADSSAAEREFAAGHAEHEAWQAEQNETESAINDAIAALHRQSAEAARQDYSFAAEVIRAFLALGVCPAGYDRDDLWQFAERLVPAAPGSTPTQEDK